MFLQQAGKGARFIYKDKGKRLKVKNLNKLIHIVFFADLNLVKFEIKSVKSGDTILI